MAKSNIIKSLEQLEKSITKQAEVVNKYQQASIEGGYSTSGQNWEKEQRDAEKILQMMNEKYQKTLRQASNILKNI